MEGIRNNRFNISLKLSLVIGIVVIISFFFVFYFYINSTKQDFIERIDSEISIKIDTLKQDIINFSLGVEEGDFRLTGLEDKILGIYNSSNSITVFSEIDFINKDGIILTSTEPKNRMKSFFEVEKKYGKEHYEYVYNLFTIFKNDLGIKEHKDFLNIRGKSMYQIFMPVYYKLSTKESSRLDTFFEFYNYFKKEGLLKEVSTNLFYLNSFYLFYFINEYNNLYDNGKLTTGGSSLISESINYYRTILKINRRAKGFIPPFYPISEEDIKNIDMAINGIQYFVKTYWYTRIKTGKDIIKAVEKISLLADKKVISNILKDIIDYINLLKSPSVNYEDIKPKILVSIKKLEEIYRATLLPFKDILTEREENLLNYMESMLIFLNYLEANLKSIDKVIQRIVIFDNNIKNLSFRTIKLLKNYLVVSVKEQDYAVNKAVIIKALDSVYRIKVFEAYKNNTSNFEEVKKSIGEEINYLKKLILENQAFYKPIEIKEEALENTLTLRDYKDMLSYFFFIYVNDFIRVFKTGNQIKDNIYSILKNPIPIVYKTFSEKTISDLENSINKINYFIVELRRLSKEGDIYVKIEDNKIEELFRNLVSRYQIGYLLVRVSQDKLEEALNIRINSLIDLFVNLLIRFLFVSVIFSLIFLNRFKKINNGITLIGQGNFDHKIIVSGNDEIGQLADHLNIMTQHLKEKTRMETELNAARIIQESLLPKEYPNFKNLRFMSYYSAQVETSGDYFDFIKINDEKVALVIADVSGHGVGACLVMSMIKTIIKTYVQTILNPKELLLRVNDYLFKNTPSNIYATIFYGILDVNGSLVYSVAGHNPSILFYTKNKEIKVLETGGMACGLVDNNIFVNTINNYTSIMPKNSIFIQYTDGITEAENSNKEQYGFERLKNVILSYKGEDIKELFDLIIKDVNSFTGGVLQSDDITMMGVQLLEV